MIRVELGKNQFFDLFGYDILVDNNLKAWLLEINASPSLGTKALIDKRIKTSLITDVFNLIGVVPFNKLKPENYQAEYDEKSLLMDFEEEQSMFFNKIW